LVIGVPASDDDSAVDGRENLHAPSTAPSLVMTMLDYPSWSRTV